MRKVLKKSDEKRWGKWRTSGVGAGADRGVAERLFVAEMQEVVLEHLPKHSGARQRGGRVRVSARVREGSRKREEGEGGGREGGRRLLRADIATAG